MDVKEKKNGVPMAYVQIIENTYEGIKYARGKTEYFSVNSMCVCTKVPALSHITRFLFSSISVREERHRS